MNTGFYDSLKYWVFFSKRMWASATYFPTLSWQVTCWWRITNSHKQNGCEMKVLTLVLIRDLHSIFVPQHLRIFNQTPEISVDVIPTLLWPRYQSWHHNIFPFVAQPRGKVQNHQHNWPCAMCAVAHEWVHTICAHCDPNIPRINGKFRILWINVSPLCGISKMSYHSGILLMLLFVPSQWFWILLVCNPILQTKNDRKVPKHLFRPAFSSVVILIITAVFSTIESVESRNTAFLKVFVLSPKI
jgi:hypothetical protein